MSTITVPSFELNNGFSIPSIGLGVFVGVTDASEEAMIKYKEAEGWILAAIKEGYRHIDTARIYRTEGSVGNAIRECGIPRSEFFVTTKLPWHHEGDVKRSFQNSLDALGLDYIDLYLMHWPQKVVYDPNNQAPKGPDGALITVAEASFNDTWAEIEELLASGKVKSIGVSNFSIKNLEKLLQTAKVVPAVNQVEMHPYLAQKALLKYCKEKGILLTAYTPTGYAAVRENPVVVELAKKYNVSSAQIILAWHVSRGTPAIVKSENPQRQKDNITLVALSTEDLERIDALDRNERLSNFAYEGNGYKVWGWSYEQLGWN